VNAYFNVRVIVLIMELVHRICEVNGAMIALLIEWLHKGNDQLVFEISNTMTPLNE